MCVHTCTHLDEDVLTDSRMKAEHQYIARSKITMYDIILSEDFHSLTYLYVYLDVHTCVRRP
jgi:hypothetical protein